MTTFSFDFPLAKTDSDEVFDPGTGYTITLCGDAGKPTWLRVGHLDAKHTQGIYPPQFKSFATEQKI